MAKPHLPPAMTALRPHLAKSVEKLEQRSPYAAVLLSSREGTLIEIEQREEKISQLPLSAGTVVSCFDDGVLVERSLPGFEAGRLDRAVGELARGLSAANGAAPVPQGVVQVRDFATSGDVLAGDLRLEEKLERCRNVQQRLAAMEPRIVNVRVRYSEETVASVFRDRQSDLAQTIVRLRLSVMVVLSEGAEVRYDWQSKGGTGGWEVLEYSDEELRAVVDGAVRLFSAERIEPGEYDVVSGPGVSGVLAHESFGHGVETDLFPKERARSFDYLGRKVGSPLVDIVDDPSLPGGYSSYFFDDEGMLSRPTTIVEKGIFRSGITDRLSAGMLGVPRTANGRRQDYTRKPYARMSNTFFGPGAASVDDIFAQVERGIFLDRWINGMEDPQGWGIQITCHYGQEILNGRLTERVFSPVSLSGYVPQVLETIRAASSTVEMDQGTCGKGHKEYVPNSSGGPHLLLRMNLG
jgi:TldD protein